MQRLQLPAFMLMPFAMLAAAAVAPLAARANVYVNEIFVAVSSYASTVMYPARVLQQCSFTNSGHANVRRHAAQMIGAPPASHPPVVALRTAAGDDDDPPAIVFGNLVEERFELRPEVGLSLAGSCEQQPKCRQNRCGSSF